MEFSPLSVTLRKFAVLQHEAAGTKWQTFYTDEKFDTDEKNGGRGHEEKRAG